MTRESKLGVYIFSPERLRQSFISFLFDKFQTDIFDDF